MFQPFSERMVLGQRGQKVLLLLTREGQRLEKCLVSPASLAEGCQESKVMVGQAYSLGQRLVCEKP